MMSSKCCCVRNRNQRYVYWMFESPAHLHYDATTLETTRDFYNWSLTYRQDSTFPAAYGIARKVPHHTHRNTSLLCSPGLIQLAKSWIHS